MCSEVFDPAPIACATDEAESRFGWNTSNSFNVGSYDDVDNQLTRNYEGIRKANVFLSKKDIIPFPSQEMRERIIRRNSFSACFLLPRNHQTIWRHAHSK